MRDEDPAYRPVVGQQLAERRDQLKLTQRSVASLIGITSRTVSAIERGENSIQPRFRPSWEQKLRLVTGTIDSAYNTGSPIEVLPEPTAEEIAFGTNTEFTALLSARVADLAEHHLASDERIERLTARVERVEEHLDEERRIRETLEQTLIELTRALPADPAYHEGK